MSNDQKRILVIAGSDSSGGAGVEADQKVIAAHGCYAMTATTALTAQNTQGVLGIHETPAAFVAQQIEAVVGDVGVDVVKTGMLASAETISVVADALRKYNIPVAVIDPVMVATSGAALLPTTAMETLCTELLPLTTILTPNLPEAQVIIQHAGKSHPEPKSVDDIVAMAKAIQELGPKWVLLKGGHLPLTRERVVSGEGMGREIVLNVLVGEGETVVMESEYIESKNTHGTGCSLASAIASRLATGMPMKQAVETANYYIEAGIKTAKNLGQGSGPINHFHSTYTLPFSPGHFLPYLLSRPDVSPHWHSHTHHPFVQQMASGTLPLAKFKNYLIQDYLFLTQFSRANALAAYKANSMHDINASARIIQHIRDETALHITYCEGFGVSREDLEGYEESQACTAYTRFVLDTGMKEDWFALQVALLPCLLGYGVIARRLYEDPQTVRGEGNRYWTWIENYVAEDYVQAVETGKEIAETHAVRQSPHRIEELVKIFIHATKMEMGFWDMGSL